MIHAGQLEVDRFPFDASADAIRSIMVDTASVARELLCLCSLTFKLPQHFAVFSGVSGRLSKTKLICELKTGLCTCVRSSQEGAEHRLTRNWTQHVSNESGCFFCISFLSSLRHPFCDLFPHIFALVFNWTKYFKH